MRKLYLACAIHFAFSTNTYALEHIDSTENIVLQWNDAVLQAVRETYATPPVVARHLAILNTSIFDAWAVFDNKAKGTQLGKTLKAPATLNTAQNKQEAIAYAAFRTANDLFPLTVQKAFFTLTTTNIRVKFNNPACQLQGLLTQIGRGIRIILQDLHDISCFQYGADATAYGLATIGNHNFQVDVEPITNKFK